MHRIDVRGSDQNELPRPERNGGKGERITPNHHRPVPGEVAATGGQNAEQGKGEPKDIQQHKGDPAGQ
jgi:hypothetical protein